MKDRVKDCENIIPPDGCWDESKRELFFELILN